MKLSRTPLIILSLFIALIGVSVFAQGGAQSSPAPAPTPAPQPTGRPWGVVVTDPAIDAMRDQMIQQAGVDAVVAARFSAAVNRLTILDTRITSLIDNTSDACRFTTSATKELADARATLSTVDTSALITSSDTTTAPDTAMVTPSIDPATATRTQSTLDSVLGGMKTAVATISQCPEYIQTDKSGPLPRTTTTQ